MDRRGTSRLVSGDYSLEIKKSQTLRWVAVIVFVLGSALFAYSKFLPESPAADLIRNATRLAGENLNLRSAIERAQLEMRHEMATRNALEKQVKDLTAEVKRLQDELAFIRSQKKQ